MKIHEYQAKEIFRKYNIPTTKEKVASSLAEAKAIMNELQLPIVVKAQVLVGGRGKAGGVKLVNNPQELESAVNTILGMQIKGLTVRKVLLAEAVKIDAEYYVGITIDRETQSVVLIASASGGVDIEEVAIKTPEKIIKESINPLLGLKVYQVRNIGYKLFDDASIVNSFTNIALNLYKIFGDLDCSLVEINPLVKSGDKLIAVDAKIVFDDNALSRHPDIVSLRDLDAEEPLEVQAKQADLSYVKLDGNVGCVVNGAGLAMATMDLIKRYGGNPANFLDIGGSSSPEKMRTAMKILTADKNVKAILVNIFGGITRCDDVAQGLLWAIKEEKIKLPIVARLVGTNQEQARAMLQNSPIIFAETMTEAVKKVNELLKG
ncbi:MAG: ADP-forming succinate--CoA ligase subunit beta [candidate division WOR-3 bacterium]|nr:ADP-forming succinate--CoA ligase subunit beta [candidate division WOR-3 bacterium]